MRKIKGKSYEKPSSIIKTTNIIFLRTNMQKITEYDETLEEEVELYLFDEFQYSPNEYYHICIEDMHNQNILVQQEITNLELLILEK